MKHSSQSVEELLEGENWVKRNLIDKYGWPITEEIVNREFDLQIRKENLPDDVEAMLCPDSSHNGRIALNQNYADAGKCLYMHEVIRYLLDVGIGNKVRRSFVRMRL